MVNVDSRSDMNCVLFSSSLEMERVHHQPPPYLDKFVVTFFWSIGNKNVTKYAAAFETSIYLGFKFIACN